MEELILKEREVKENIVQIINTSGLPAIVIKPVLQDILRQVELVEQKEYLLAYQNAQEVKEQDKKQGGDKKGKQYNKPKSL